MGKKRERKELEKKKGRTPCCEKEGVKRGAWTPEEDKILVHYITQNGHGTWRNVPKFAGLLRCGKSCRLRWTNYLRPDIKRGPFSPEEENTIIQLQNDLGNKWAAIASHLPGRTDNDIKNFWNSHIRKRFSNKNLDQSPSSSKSVNMNSDSPSSLNMVQWDRVRLEAESHLSIKSLLLDVPPVTKFKGDCFLRLWNSDVGESFRKMNERDGTTSQSPASKTSSLTGSKPINIATSPCKTIETGEQKVELLNCKKEKEDVELYLDALKPYEVDDSSDSMLKLLLDFPVGGDDLGFLQEPFEDVSTYIQG